MSVRDLIGWSKNPQSDTINFTDRVVLATEDATVEYGIFARLITREEYRHRTFEEVLNADT